MDRLGLHIYFWGEQEQNRLLREWLGPTVRRLLEAARIRQFWFNRFDARGPHLMVFVEASSDASEPLREELEEALSAYLEKSPSGEVLAAELLEERHRSCRGKALSALDKEPGIAANNSFAFFAQEPPFPPHWYGGHLSAADARRLGEELTRTALWTIDRLDDAVVGGAAWFAEVDRQVGVAGGGEAAAQWRFHATTLLLGLEQRLAEREAEIVAGLPELVGEHNQEIFNTLWDRSREVSGLPDLGALIELLSREEDVARRRARIREVCHFTLKQLGLPVSWHIPLVLHAWSRRAGRGTER